MHVRVGHSPSAVLAYAKVIQPRQYKSRYALSGSTGVCMHVRVGHTTLSVLSLVQRYAEAHSGLTSVAVIAEPLNTRLVVLVAPYPTSVPDIA
eukprot:2397924-Rhodomonas_salina.2